MSNAPPATPIPADMPSPAMDELLAVAALGALAQGMRLRVFRTLVGAGPAGLTPGSLSASLGVPSSTLSFHLKELTQAGLVSPQRDGRHLIYRPSIARMNELIGYLTDHCCQGADTPGCAIRTPSGTAACCEPAPHPPGPR